MMMMMMMMMIEPAASNDTERIMHKPTTSCNLIYMMSKNKIQKPGEDLQCTGPMMPNR